MELKFKKGDLVKYGPNKDAVMVLTGENFYNPLDDTVLWRGMDIHGNYHEIPQYKLELVKNEKPPALTFDAFLKANIERCNAGFGHKLEDWSLLEWGGACAGEIGEACNKAKKLKRFDNNIKGNKPGENQKNLLDAMGKEIADAVVYAFLWFAAAGLDPAEYVRKVFNDKSDEIGSDIKI